MKKMIAILLMIALLIPAGAMADNIQLELMDTITVDAPAPKAPAEVSAQLKVEFVTYDAEMVKSLLMPNEQISEVRPNADGTIDMAYGEWGADVGHLIVQGDMGMGRIYYDTAFYQKRLQQIIRTGDEMVDFLKHYPQDREVEGFARTDAQAQADALIDALGVRDCIIDERAYTIDTLSYEMMLEALRVSDFQAQIPRTYLENYDREHDGYLFTYNPAIGGLPIVGGSVEKPAIFVTRQGIEHVDMDVLMRIASADADVPTIDAVSALHVAKPQIEAVIKRDREYVIGEQYNPNVPVAKIERIRFGYTFKERDGATYDYDLDWTTAYPAWEYTYLRAMWKDEGDWRTRSFDNSAFIGRLILDGVTGDYIVSQQR